MIKVAALSTVWKRPLITAFHFKWMFRFRAKAEKEGVQIIPFYVLSPDDSCLELFTRALKRHRLHYTVVPNQRLSQKTQAGLYELKDEYDFDYLMHLDSDEIVSMELLRRWKELWDGKTLWFGSEACYFFDIGTKKGWEFLTYNDHPVKNGGTCVHKSILREARWELWPTPRNQGLNVMERRRIEDLGHNILPVNTQDIYGVTELKGSDAIHPMAWFFNKGLVSELGKARKEELLDAHPDLRLLV